MSNIGYYNGFSFGKMITARRQIEAAEPMVAVASASMICCGPARINSADTAPASTDLSARWASRAEWLWVIVWCVFPVESLWSVTH